MPKHFIKYFLSFLLFMFAIICDAQIVAKPKQAKSVMQLDSSEITPAKFDKEAISNYKDQKEFQYDELQVRQLSLWDRF